VKGARGTIVLWGGVWYNGGMKKLRVGILFGGRSAEHEVSLQSAKNIYEAIDRDRFEPVLIGIDKSGKWVVFNDDEFLVNADDPKNIRLNPRGLPAALLPQSLGKVSAIGPSAGDEKNGGGDALFVDVVFPMLHGPFGEDGTVQGLLKLAGIPFVGAGVLGSAAGMDKDVTKRLLKEAGIPIGKYITLNYYDAIPSYSYIIEKLAVPLFVKPANMGSSVGVNKVHDEKEYNEFIRDAFLYDTKIVLEEFIPGREIECAVLGNEDVIASLPGEIKPTHEFYSYDAKYLDENGATLEIPAKLSSRMTEEIRQMAIKTFKTLCCEGLSRVDFFLTNDGKLYVNEINTMPGFTKISMYPKLFAASGVTYSELVTRLIELAIERCERETRLHTSYAGTT
jgi:D-alanine-D-alanine ligase